MTKIGDTLWFSEGFSRDRWYCSKIVGETSLSWLVGGGKSPRKINKKTMLEAQGKYFPIRWHTEEGMRNHIWRGKHAYNIGQYVGTLDAETLKKVAELIGYKFGDDK
jgi:hypothetical protein